MIRRRVCAEPAFYYSDEIGRSPMSEFYDAVDEVIGDWDAVALPLTHAFSRTLGRPTDPVLYLKMFLIGYFQNVVYDTRLVAICSDSMAIRRFLGLTLSDRVPDHSRVSAVRASFAEHCSLQRALERVVDLCVLAGLVDGRSVSVDTTLIKANASLKNLHCLDTNGSVGEHLKQARESGQKPTVTNAQFYSPGDPEARVRKKGPDKAAMCYTGVHVTDSKAQVILAARMDYGDAAEVSASLPAVAQAQETLAKSGKQMDVVAADKGFDVIEFHTKLEAAGLRPATFSIRVNQVEGRFNRSDFEFDASNNLYRCPWGKELNCRGPKGAGFAYVAKISDCSGCPLKHRCLGEKSERKELSRTTGEDASERNKQFASSREGRKHLKKRGHTVEPPFGHLKRYGGLERVNCQGLAKADAKLVIGAMAWNILKLVKSRPRPVGQGKSAPRTQPIPPGTLQAAIQLAKEGSAFLHLGGQNLLRALRLTLVAAIARVRNAVAVAHAQTCV